MHEALKAQYTCPCHTCIAGITAHHTITLSAADDPGAGEAAAYEELFRKIYDGTVGDIDKDTVLDTAATFMEGVYKGYGKDFASVAYDSPDYQMLAAFERNVFQFSAAKNYHELKELTLQLKDGDRTRTYPEFRREALKIVDTWDNNYGKTEYNTGVAAAQSIANWERFEKNKAVMNLLRFSGVHDVKECPICKAYDGLVRPVDDPIWDVANVPLHFNDRCLVEQLADNDTPQTPDDKLPPKEVIPKMFRVNQAKEQVIFPLGSAYFKDMPKALRKDYVNIQTSAIRSWAKDNLVGKSVKMDKIGHVGFTVRGIKEALNQPHDHYLEKNQSLYKVQDMLKNATYVRSVPDAKGRGMDWHYAEVMIADKPSYAVIRDIKGEKTFYSIVDKLK